MTLEILQEDGFAKLGKLRVAKKFYKTPCLCEPIFPVNEFPYIETTSKVGDEIPKIYFLPSLQYLDDFKRSISLETIEGIIVLPKDNVLAYKDNNELNNTLNMFLFSEKIIKGFQYEFTFGNSATLTDFLLDSHFSCLVSQELSATQFSSQNLLQKAIHLNSLPIPNMSLYVPAIVPMFVPLLVYLGIDLFDTIACNIAASKGIYFLRNSSIKFTELREYPCLCSACQNQSEDNWLREHNTHLLKLRILETQNALIQGTLRELLRESAARIPLVKEVLRLIDKNYSSPLLVRTPVNRKVQLICSDETDFSRPEVQNFRMRVKTRYTPPSDRELVIILPCSAKKPYSISSSHLAFRKAIKSGLGRKKPLIAEVIVTSPLGIVPRELESIYPASHYDIPVTGDWNELEQQRVKEDLHSYLNKFAPETSILVHLGEPEKSIVQKSLNEFQWVGDIVFTEITDNPKSLESLFSLKAAIHNICKETEFIGGKAASHRIQAFRAMADYQFGKEIGEVLFPDEIVIKGKPEIMQKVFLNKTQLATYSRSKGWLNLNLAGAERIAQLKVPKIIFDGQTISGGSIFGAGIKSVNSEFQPKDHVIVMSPKEEVIAVGEAVISSLTMRKRQKGVAIKIRQKRREK
ncbi:MAG: DUF5591 domain-containing protein [Candidatus Hermodarchaeota archaeon]